MSLWKDARFAFRQLRKSPAFTLIVLATLGLCVGVNTAIYSVLDAVLLRPAPYPQSDRLAVVTTHYWNNGKEDEQNGQTGALFEAVRQGASLIDVAAYAGGGGVNLTAGGHAEYVKQQRVSTGFFRVLSVSPQFGREFLPAEDVRSGPPVAVLAGEFWQRTFHGDPAVLGHPIMLRGEPYTVVGIMPPGFRSNVPADVWTPLRPSRSGEGGGINYGVIARLNPGATWATANQQLAAVSRGIAEGSPRGRNVRFEERVIPIQSGLTHSVRTELLITWAAVVAVLLIGCVNITGLLLARASSRGREIATRLALGAGRASIVRQLLMESLLLATGGGIAGIAVGTLAIGWLKQLGAGDFELWHPIQMDARVLLAMLAVAMFTSIVFGLMPALSISRIEIRSVLVEGARGVAGGQRRWSRQALVACEVALSLVLLVAAGLLVRTLSYLNGLSAGFDAHNIITAQASLQDARYSTSPAVNLLYRRSLDRIRQIPGVQGAAVALTLPYERPINDGFQIVGDSDTNTHGMEMVYTTPGYLEMMRIPVYRGREFRDADTSESAKVIVVSQFFAAKYFRGQDPIGRQLKIEGDAWQIVGVSGDIQQHSGLSDLGPLAVSPTVYMPAAQVPEGFFKLVHVWVSPKWIVRGAGPTGALTQQIQGAMASIDPLLPIAKFQTVDEIQAQTTSSQRYDAALFSTLAGLALLLAGIGLYGLISQSIGQRTRELGIRLALGATSTQMVVSAMKPGLLLALAGAAAGYLASHVAVRFLEHMLWGVRTDDSFTFVSTAAILLAVAALASLVPALRILRLDPAQTLRSE